MASATDLITYIGVPLTVAGVLPLIWNMLLAIRIWIKLKNSIPAGFKEYYTLIPDPAAGKVVVVARVPSLDSPGLWAATKSTPVQSEKLSTSKSKAGPPVSTSLFAMSVLGAVPAAVNAIPSALRGGNQPLPKSLQFERFKLLGRPWMSVVKHCNLVLRDPEDEDSETGVKEGLDEEARFTVESDMKSSDRTPLKMQWVQFIWFALALGVNAYDPCWSSGYPCTLRNMNGEDLIRVFEEEDRLFARLALRQEANYSLRRALAWYNIELQDNCLLLLGHKRSPGVPLEHVRISAVLSTCRLAKDLTLKPQDNLIRGREPQDCENGLAAACYWMFYRRRYQLETGGEILPVSQHLLEYRQRVLCHLKHMDDEKSLEAAVERLLKVSSQ